MDTPFGSWGTNPGLRPFRAELIHWINSKTPFTLHRRLQRRCLDRTMGYQGRDGWPAYVAQVLVPELEPGTVVIMDNLAPHKNTAAAKAMRHAGCWFLVLAAVQP